MTYLRNLRIRRPGNHWPAVVKQHGVRVAGMDCIAWQVSTNTVTVRAADGQRKNLPHYWRHDANHRSSGSLNCSGSTKSLSGTPTASASKPILSMLMFRAPRSTLLT